MLLWVLMCISVLGQTCVDIKDNIVDEGYYFTPKGDDPCLSCTCHNGEPEMCVAALCERPQGCQQYRKDPKECCKFTCLDPGKALLEFYQVKFLLILVAFGYSFDIIHLSSASTLPSTIPICGKVPNHRI